MTDNSESFGTDHPIFRIYEGLDQLGPGSDACTERALRLVMGLPEHPKILDLGCGTGRQTLALARLTSGNITAVDMYKPYLAQLRERAQQYDLDRQITTVAGDMTALDLSPYSFDLVWSEGAIYLMGFEAGLQSWRSLLRPGGAIAVTEVSWLVEYPTARVRDYWAGGYPAITSVSDNLATIVRCGFETLGHFTLPAAAWWTPYYKPLQAHLNRIEPDFRGDPAAETVIAETREEMALFRDHSDSYGYVFYVMRRVD